MKHTRSVALALAAALALLAVPSASRAQAMQSDSVLRDFQATSDYTVVIDGKPVTAEVYQNNLPAILILSSSLQSPVLITPRAGTVQSVNIMKVAKQADGTVDLLADAVLAPLGSYQLEGESPTFTAQGKKVALNPKPPLLGVKTNADLKSYMPEYARGARGYIPNGAAIASLKKDAVPVRVRVFFGSWCPHCRQHVPLLLKVEDEVKNPKITFEYKGLPRDFNDPEAKQLGIRSVPTGIVYVNGREIGRITGEGWNAPEVLLNKLVSGVQPAAAPSKSKAPATAKPQAPAKSR